MSPTEIVHLGLMALAGLYVYLQHQKVNKMATQADVTDIVTQINDSKAAVLAAILSLVERVNAAIDSASHQHDIDLSSVKEALTLSKTELVAAITDVASH